jgi:hypothetical protein
VRVKERAEQKARELHKPPIGAPTKSEQGRG